MEQTKHFTSWIWPIRCQFIAPDRIHPEDSHLLKSEKGRVWELIR